MKTFSFVLLTVVAAVQAQPPNPPVLPPSVATYLDLTAAQSARLIQNRNEYQRFLLEKSRRESIVRGEIAVETQKTVVDPMALGVRYLELEAICRESNAAFEKNRTDNLAVLTDAQRVRLNALNDVIRLMPVVSEAQSLNLLPGGFGVIPGSRIGGLPIGDPDIVSGLLGPGPFRMGPGCQGGGFGLAGLGGLIGFGAPEKK